MEPVKDIPVDDIIVPPNHRTPLNGKVASMAKSLAEVGRMLQPIMVRKSPTKPNKYELVFGGHRLAGAKVAGWKKVPCIVTTMGELECELAEIEDNFAKRHMTTVEEAVVLSKRKELYRRIVLDNATQTVPDENGILFTRGIPKRLRLRPPQQQASGTQDVYFIQAKRGGPIKIGCSDNIPLRMRAIQSCCPFRLILLGVIRGIGIQGERKLHRLFWQHRIHGEWFRDCEQIRECISSHAQQ